MPFLVKKIKGGYKVVNKLTGESKGISKSRKMALAHLRALYANSKD